MNRFQIITLLAFNFLLSLSAFSSKPYYHKVVAESGDNVHTLLDRYDLATFTCNIDQFYDLNELKKGSKLIAAKKYFLPVLIYKYNGVSIKSSVGFKDWEPAYRIKKYNEKLKREKLRRSTLVRSKIIWVPYHELHCTESAPADPTPPIAAANTNVSPRKDKKEKVETSVKKRTPTSS